MHIISILCLYLALLGKSETVSIRGKRNQNKVSTLEHTEGKQNRSHTSNVDSFPELKRERKFQTTKGNRTVRKAKTYSTNTDHVKSGKSDDVIPQQPSKEGKAKSTDSERKRANFRAFYQRMKARKARGDKKGKEWFEARSARFSEIETGLTHRMQTATYTQTDLKRYQKRIARQARYREKRRRSKIDLNQVPSDHISQENRKEWTVPALN